MCVFSCSPLLSIILTFFLFDYVVFCAGGFSEGIHTLKLVLKLCSHVLFISEHERNATTENRSRSSSSSFTGGALIGSVTLVT